MHWKNGLWLLATGILILAGGCHLIVGIRDAEPYPPDAGAGGTAACTPSQTQVCYGGPEQTEGVGVCRRGTQACTPEGVWGACEGEVLPGAEDCSAPGDEDCNGYACSETAWVKQFGVQSTNAYSSDIAVDLQTGDIYVTGSFSGALPIGSDTLDSQGGTRIAFLAKFDQQGTPLWAQQFGEATDFAINAQGTSVVVDGQGNVVLVGSADTPVNLGGAELPEGLFVGKFTPSGQHLWSLGCQTQGGTRRGAVDPSTNDVVVAGTFGSGGQPPITCGAVTFMSNGADVFVARFAALDGSMIFAKQFGGSGSDNANDVAVDEQGSILLGGNGDDLTLGGPPLADGYVAKLASNGSHVWGKGIGAGWTAALALDASGGLALTGSGSGILNFGDEDLAPVGAFDVFVARLDASGKHVWSRRFGSAGGNLSLGQDVAVDSKGNLAVSGTVTGNIAIDDVILAGNATAFLAKVDANGQIAWSKTFGKGPCSLAFSSLDELVVACQSAAPADFGKGLATPVGESDLFLLKIAP